MPKLTIQIKKYGDFLGTRKIGGEIREYINEEWDKFNIIVFDMGGVKGLTNSFADECFGKLLLEKGLDEFNKKLRFKNLNPLVRTVLHFVLGRRYRERKSNLSKKEEE